MRRSSPHSDKNYFWTRKNDDDGNATVLTVVSSLDNSTPSKFTTKNVFRLNKSSHDEKKIYFGPSSSKNPCGVRIYIKNENNITNYNTGPPIPPPPKSREYAEPIIMPSFNTRRNRSNSFKSSIDTDSDSKPKTFASTQRAMSFLKKDLLSNRNDFAFLKKPVVHSNKDPPIFQPLKTPPPIVSPRRSEFLTDFPVIKEPFQPYQPFQPILRRNFSECLSSKHRPWVIKPSQTQNKQVQTDLPILRPNVDVNKRSTLTSTQQQQQQQFQQQTNSSSNNTESSLFLKKQESSNFSMFKGMNSNDLFNYIDDVISQFRAKTRLLDDEEDEREREKLSEFSGTIFYPEDQETTATTTTTTTTGPSLNRDETIDLKRVKRSERLNVHELSTIMSSDDENEIVISSNDDKNFVESKPFSNSKESPNEDIDDDNEDESSTFINYTHSMEIDDESNDDEEDENDETLDDDK